MKKILRAGVSALSILVASSVFALSAVAEDAAPATTKPAATTTAPAVAKPAKVVTKAADPAKPVVKRVATVSPCKGLDEKTCGGNKACDWIVPKDANDKTGKVQEPYCRKVAGVALKKAVAKPAAAATTATKPVAKVVNKAAAPVTAPVTAAAKPPAPQAAQ